MNHIGRAIYSRPIEHSMKRGLAWYYTKIVLGSQAFSGTFQNDSPFSTCEWDFLLSWSQLTVIHFNIMPYIYTSMVTSDLTPLYLKRSTDASLWRSCLDYEAALGCFGLSYNHLIHTYWNLLCSRCYAGTRDTQTSNSAFSHRELGIWWEK